MANSGVIQQFKGPFYTNQTLNIPSVSYCRIGISIGQDDYLQWEANHNEKLKVQINEEDIFIGQTFMYQTNYPIGVLNQVYTTITFPDGAPESTIVDIVYSDVPYEYQVYEVEEE